VIVAIYARVSTSDQSCEMQLHELRQYVAKRGWEVFQEYVDTGFSGAAASRPRLDQLLRDARLRKFEGVLVWKLDRWGRSVAHCVRSIQELVSLGVRFLSPTESIDTGAESPMSKFLLHLFAAFAEMERGIIRERVCAGVRAAKAKGTLVTDRFSSYEAEELAGVAQHKCLSHLIRNVAEVVNSKTGRAKTFGSELKALLQDANALWRQQRAGTVSRLNMRLFLHHQ